MIIHAIRLKPNQDLKKELVKFSNENKIRAGCFLSGVGSLNAATLHMAGNEIITKNFSGFFEIVSITGTISADGIHAHISLAKQNREVIGGHLKDNCIIHTTAEIIIAVFDDLEFSRILDDQTGFKELVIRNKHL